MLHVYHLDPTKLRVFAITDDQTAKKLVIEQRSALGLHWTHVADVARESVDEAFTLTNNIDCPWTSNTDVHTIGNDHKRSTSPGDIIVRDGQAWLCSSFGWVDLGTLDFLN